MQNMLVMLLYDRIGIPFVLSQSQGKSMTDETKLDAMLYGYEDVDHSEAVTEMYCSECEHTWTADGVIPEDLKCPYCGLDNVAAADDTGTYSIVNGT